MIVPYPDSAISAMSASLIWPATLSISLICVDCMSRLLPYGLCIARPTGQRTVRLARHRIAGQPLDPGRLHPPPRGGKRAVEVDGAAAILDHRHGKSFPPRIDRRVVDAEIRGETGEEDAGEAALAQIAGKAGGGALVVLPEGGVGIDVAAETLAHDHLGARQIEPRMECGARRLLHAMI